MPAIKIINDHILPGKNGKPILVDAHIPDYQGLHPVVLFSHGFKGFKDWGPFNRIARHFAERGVVFIKFNFAFNGTTPADPHNFVDLEAFGNNTLTRELDDLETVLSWTLDNAANFNINTSNVTLLGHSRGGGIAILKGSDDYRVTRMATWASVVDFTRHVTKNDVRSWKETGVFFVENARTGQFMPLYIQIYNDYIRNHKKFHIRNAVKMLTKPLFIAHGTLDDTVPHEHAEELLRTNPEKVQLLSVIKGDHTFGAMHPFAGEYLPDDFQMVVNETINFIFED